MCPTGDDWHFGGETEPLGVKLQFWSPERAEQEFLALFAALSAPSDTPESAGVAEEVGR